METLVYASDLLVSERARALVEGVEPARRLALSGDVFCTLSERDEPQGIAAVVRIEDRPLAAMPLADDMLVVIAYQLRVFVPHGDGVDAGSILSQIMGISSATPGITSSLVRMVEPKDMRSATERPSRAPSRISSTIIATASG